MNHNFDRTKTATARFSTRAIALMLFFVMLLTAIGSGSVISAIATEINSTVSAAVTLPIVIGVTQKMGLNPIPYIFTTAMGMNYESLLPVSVRAISVGYGLDPEKLLKDGFLVTLIRMLVAVIAGYIMLIAWPGFGVLS